MHGYPTLTEKFEQQSFDALRESKKIVKQINPEILEVPANIEDSAGMFLWAKIKDYSLLEKAKVNAIDGKHFGMPGFIRMNLALPEDQMKEIVKRLNSAKEL
jgi:aspartate/methionine/tyrosine aminotransferase